MAGLTLDTAALIAYERNNVRIYAMLRRASQRNTVVTVPAGVLAQAWRDRRGSRLAALLADCHIEPLDDRLARACGTLCGLAGTSDVVDASVVVGAAMRGDAVVTSDYADIARLAAHVRGLGPIIPLD